MKRRFFGHRRGPLRATMVVAAALLASGAEAQDRAEIDRTQIIGNRELPKVTYIVPWKKPLPGDFDARSACRSLFWLDLQALRFQISSYETLITG